jgi:hypothetical protein
VNEVDKFQLLGIVEHVPVFGAADPSLACLEGCDLFDRPSRSQQVNRHLTISFVFCPNCHQESKLIANLDSERTINRSRCEPTSRPSACIEVKISGCEAAPPTPEMLVHNSVFLFFGRLLKVIASPPAETVV